MRQNLSAALAIRDPGSFRDPDGFVFHRDRSVYRAVLPLAVPGWRQFQASGLAQELESAGLVVQTVEVSDGAIAAAADLPPGSIILEHDPVTFLNYPYEWTFSMLRDAALLQLEIMERSLRKQWVLKDASAYNVQFRGASPVFLDVLSFAPICDGEPWAGYHQFCRMMLYPLMLQAYKHVPFQPWLRSDLEGIDPETFGCMFRGIERLRPGVLTHVTAQAYLQHKFARADYSIRNEVKSAGISPAMIARNVAGLKKLVLGLRPEKTETTWSSYSRDHYQTEALQTKEEFVREAIGGRPLRLVWDLGCNDGRFSRIAAENAETVIAMDSDAGTIDRLYGQLRTERLDNVLPLVMNIANPSPSQGWASSERQSLIGRGHPDLTLALALLHHLVISANVPLEAVFDWLGQVTRELVIEFMSKDDPMVRLLLLNKDDTYYDYSLENFEWHLEQHFTVNSRVALPGGTRFLYHATVRSGGPAKPAKMMHCK